jgi:hypothetical protein
LKTISALAVEADEVFCLLRRGGMRYSRSSNPMILLKFLFACGEPGGLIAEIPLEILMD